MKKLTLRSNDRTTTTYATNRDGTGVFVLAGGAYLQIRGNGQTPTFKSAKQFRRYLYRLGVRGRIVPSMSSIW
jgi:hypothetical protein